MSARANLNYRGIRAGNIKPVLLTMPAEVQDAMERHCAQTGETLAEAALRIWAEAMAAAPQARKPSGRARTPESHNSPSAGA